MKGRRASTAPESATLLTAGGHETLPSLVAKVRLRHPGTDTVLVERAYATAAVWHHGQRRRSGDPYVTHCLAVAAIVADLGAPLPVVCAALLHDVEDAGCPPEQIADQFGDEVAELVTGVPDAVIPLIAPATVCPQPGQVGTVLSREAAVVVIRLADRLHNMRTIAFLQPARQYLKARETAEVFAPLAHTMGLDTLGAELHGLAITVLQPPLSSSAVAQRVLAVLALLLPQAERGRWKEEWSAELAVHPTRRTRACFTVRVLLGAPRLSLTLRRPMRRGPGR
ncbi:HD domain-containing protein [Streptomyces sp. NBC_01478]|uniref:HD domain-containing protein n=1 Tax=Streptomyces sp. NBC_01478 TaxID=2903882 RepID=UPI002E2FED8A|nr:HD domain-containing protein [Streptomyces sp. NBC_01478]